MIDFQLIAVCISCRIYLILHLCVCVCVYWCCFTSVNYALIRHVFLHLYCTTRQALSAIDALTIYSVINDAFQFSSISTIEQCHRRHTQKKSNQPHLYTEMHKITCMHALHALHTRRKKMQQYKSQWNRKRCYTNSEHCWLLYTICSIFLFRFF